jgi:hypothetical protein
MRIELNMWTSGNRLYGDSAYWICPNCNKNNRTVIESESYPSFGAEGSIKLDVDCKCKRKFRLIIEGGWEFEVNDMYLEDGRSW